MIIAGGKKNVIWGKTRRSLFNYLESPIRADDIGRVFFLQAFDKLAGCRSRTIEKFAKFIRLILSDSWSGQYPGA